MEICVEILCFFSDSYFIPFTVTFQAENENTEEKKSYSNFDSCI